MNSMHCVGLFTDFLHFDEANLGFEPSAPYRQPYYSTAHVSGNRTCFGNRSTP